MWLNAVFTLGVLFSTIHQETTNGESNLASSSNSVELLKQELLPQLKEDYMKSDEFFMRWLEACDFNLSDTREHLLNFIAWHANLFKRERRNLAVEEEISISVILDKEGNPVVLYDMSKINLRKLYNENQIQKFVLHAMQAIDKACEIRFARQKSGRSNSRISVLVDWTGFNREDHLCPECIQQFVELIVEYEAHYPLTVDNVVYFNTPAIVNNMLLPLMKSKMSRELSQSHKVFETEQLQEGKQYLENWIGKRNIPSVVHKVESHFNQS